MKVLELYKEIMYICTYVGVIVTFLGFLICFYKCHSLMFNLLKIVDPNTSSNVLYIAIVRTKRLNI